METTKPSKSTTIQGAWIVAASGVVAAVGPLVLEAIGLTPASAIDCTQAIVVALNVLGAHVVSVGRANANIKPLG